MNFTLLKGLDLSSPAQAIHPLVLMNRPGDSQTGFDSVKIHDSPSKSMAKKIKMKTNCLLPTFLV
jgi:hypothetical protein